MHMTSDYNVALRYRPHVEGGYAGVTYWTSFHSKAAFEAWYVSREKDQEIVGKGISEGECIGLVTSTSAGVRFNTARTKATDPATGEVDKVQYVHAITGAMCALGNTMRKVR